MPSSRRRSKALRSMFIEPSTARLPSARISLGSCPILVTSGEAWYLPYCYTEETRTAIPRAPPTRAHLHLSCLPCTYRTTTAAATPPLSRAIVPYHAHRPSLAQRLGRRCLGVGVRALLGVQCC